MNQSLEYKYELSWKFLSSLIVFFLPTSLWIMTLPFQNPCSVDRKHGNCTLGSPQAEVAFKIFMIFLGIAGLALCIFALWKKIYLKPKLIIRDGEIFLPKSNSATNLESLKLNEINSVELGIAGINITCTLRTNSDFITIQCNMLQKVEFETIYQYLKENAPNAKFQIDDLRKNAEYVRVTTLQKDNPAIFITLFYAIINLISANEINNYLDNQIDAYKILPIAFFTSILLFSIIIFILKKLDAIQLGTLKKTFCIFCLIAGFLSSVKLNAEFLSKINQKYDSSSETQSIAELSNDSGQIQKDKIKNGDCYYLKSEQNTNNILQYTFGDGKICRNNFLELDPNMKVHFYYKKGLLGDRWMTSNELQKK